MATVTLVLTQYRNQRGFGGKKKIVIRETAGPDEDLARGIADSMKDPSRFIEELIALSICEVDDEKMDPKVGCPAYHKWSTRLRSLVRKEFSALNSEDKADEEDFQKALVFGE